MFIVVLVAYDIIIFIYEYVHTNVKQFGRPLIISYKIIHLKRRWIIYRY